MRKEKMGHFDHFLHLFNAVSFFGILLCIYPIKAQNVAHPSKAFPVEFKHILSSGWTLNNSMNALYNDKDGEEKIPQARQAGLMNEAPAKSDIFIGDWLGAFQCADPLGPIATCNLIIWRQNDQLIWTDGKTTEIYPAIFTEENDRYKLFLKGYDEMGKERTYHLFINKEKNNPSIYGEGYHESFPQCAQFKYEGLTHWTQCEPYTGGSENKPSVIASNTETVPSGNEYKVVIDNCHSDIGNEGTGNTITVEFLSGERVVQKTSKKGIQDCSSGAVFTVNSTEKITGINVKTDGDDGFFIDKIDGYKDGVQFMRHGHDEGRGWCVSSDPEDAEGSWRSYLEGGCWASQYFAFQSGYSLPNDTEPDPPGEPGNEYKVVIDNCHSGIVNEGSANTITVEFLDGERVVKQTSKSNIQDCSNSAVFTTKSTENITAISVKTDGDDGFFIDKIEGYKDGERVMLHGQDDGVGWCVSKEMADAEGNWSGKTIDGCWAAQYFPFNSTSPVPSGIEYKVVIDNCHSDIGNEGTGNTITVEFLSGERVVQKTSKKGIQDCSSGAVFTVNSTEKITGINVKTDGDDGFFIDKIEGYKDGVQFMRHGHDEGRGWCVSSDPEDAEGSWRSYLEGGCWASQYFAFQSGYSLPNDTEPDPPGEPGNEYKVVIDNCHSGIVNEGSANTITVEFLDGERVVKQTSKSNIQDCSNSAVFTTKSTENITAISVKTDGDDGFFIDKIEGYKDGERVMLHGQDDGVGWCVSKEMADAEGNWSGKTIDGCWAAQYFPFNSTSPVPSGIEYKVVIDNCHSDIGNEGTGNTITVEFMNGNRVVQKTSKSNIKDCSATAVFIVKSMEDITGINVKTDGNDAFYIDKIELYKAGNQVAHHGKDNGNGWCLSTDPGDAVGGWKGKLVGGCKTVHYFNFY